LKACSSLNIMNIIITGSVSSYGEESTLNIKDENSPYNPHYKYFCAKIFPSSMNFYRDTKAILTQKSIEFAKDNDLNLTAIEPAWVYGEREFNTGFYEYLKSVQQGIRFMPGNKFNKFHVIYAGDLAKAYFLAFEKKLKGVNRIIIGNPVPERMNMIHSVFCRAAGLKPPAPLPKFIAYPAGFIFELVAAILRKAKPPLISRSRINMMYDNIEYSTEKAKIQLGFTAETPLEEGIFKTVQWYKTNGFLE
ncbi:MAG: NAD-dependent epimerase/dehydratase family protein, partial [Candidatus Delongbacteria bacterium]|nr:NAD-dependent epimerase/dehydratase family protein [Candidatus Delongbacteria bacterium]MCG2760811.1 NAD-dependent epimerase/dehydratase family protein [Candidatus Delongbacteria bacterium]